MRYGAENLAMKKSQEEKLEVARVRMLVSSVRRYKAGQNNEGNNLDSSSHQLAHLSPPSP